MILIPLSQVPNQTLDVQLNGKTFTLTIHQGATSTLMDVSVNGVAVASSARIVTRQLVLFSAQETLNGNFFLDILDNESLPDYTQFGKSQFLYYLSPSEL